MYGYIYLTTNLINNKKYIGRKESEKFLGEKYLGSGTLIKKSIAKYGRDNFKVELIEECDSFEKLIEREEYWISYYNAVEDPMFYNLAKGGEGTKKGSKKSEYCKQAISIAASKRVLDKETKNKISKTVSSQIWVNNGLEETKAISDNLNDFIKNGYSLGRLKFSDAHKSNISKSKSGYKYPKEFGDKMSKIVSGSGNPMYGKTHDSKTIEILKERQSNRVWVKRGSECKRIKYSELDSYINDGWVRGMIRSSETIESIASKKSTSE